ncbi:MAG: M20 family metallopeptidase [Ruminococcaceae bacterium]|nr:M20 family metallopeptidase [Oscillospiraceae bacterium]
MNDMLFKTIDSLNEQYISFWEEICNIETPTLHKEGIDRASTLISEKAKEKGWMVEVYPMDIAGDLVSITMNPDSDGAPISFSGHLDTVHPLGSFGTPAVKRDETKIYGPGVTDCKGGIVAGFMAMDALDRCGFKGRPIHLLLQVDEESSLSKKFSIKYIGEKAKDSIAFINLEGSSRGKVCVERKGIVTFTFTVTGVEAHSSNCAKLGSNAILEAAHKIIELEKLKDDDGLTCNCGVINGGTVANTVPGKCVFKANIRFSTSEQLEWVRNYVNEIAETVYVSGCTTEVVQSGFRLAMERCDRNLELVDRINTVLAKNEMELLTPFKRKGGSDAADITSFGIPCVDSLGVEGGRIHSPEEYAYLDSLSRSAKILAVIAKDL